MIYLYLHCDQYMINSKKRKIIDMISGGISMPPNVESGLEIIDGNLSFKCPSKDGKTMHIVKIEAKNGDTLYTCDCSGGFSMKPSQYCVHINSVLIRMIREYIGNACEFVEDKEKHIKAKHMYEMLSINFDKLLV